MDTYSQEQLTALRDRHESWLMTQEGVTGTGIGLGRGGELVLRIYTAGVKPATRQAIANRLRNVPIAWEDGDIVPQ